MNDPEAPTPPTGYMPVVDYEPGRRSRSANAVLKWLVGVVALAVVVAGAALGVRELEHHGGGRTSTTLLGSGFDTVIEQESTTLTNVVCPTVPIRPGYVFDCSATVGDTTVNDVQVTEGDASGHFVWTTTPTATTPSTASSAAPTTASGAAPAG